MESNIAERWTGLAAMASERKPSGVEFLKMGFYKLCWCSGMLSCASGTEFAFLVGFAIITGLLKAA